MNYFTQHQSYLWIILAIIYWIFITTKSSISIKYTSRIIRKKPKMINLSYWVSLPTRKVSCGYSYPAKKSVMGLFTQHQSQLRQQDTAAYIADISSPSLLYSLRIIKQFYILGRSSFNFPLTIFSPELFHVTMDIIP